MCVCVCVYVACIMNTLCRVHTSAKNYVVVYRPTYVCVCVSTIRVYIYTKTIAVEQDGSVKWPWEIATVSVHWLYVVLRADRVCSMCVGMSTVSTACVILWQNFFFFFYSFKSFHSFLFRTRAVSTPTPRTFTTSAEYISNNIRYKDKYIKYDVYYTL
jgi:hypothetical protein